MLLEDLCTADVVCCAPELGVLDAALLMRQRHVGDLVVVSESGEDQTPIGMVTDRDIVVEVLAEKISNPTRSASATSCAAPPPLPVTPMTPAKPLSA